MNTSPSRLKFLVLSDVCVNPAESYSQVRVWQILRELLASGHEVAYAYLHETPSACSAALTDLARSSGLQLLGQWSDGVLTRQCYDVFYLTHLWRSGFLKRGVDILRFLRGRGANRPCIVYDSHDCLFKGVASYLPQPAADELMGAEAELRCLADFSVLISPRERLDAIARFALDPARVHVLSPVAELNREASLRPFEQRQGLCFVGFPHRSNLQALQYFLQYIYPLILQQRPDLTLRIMGSNMQALRLQYPEQITRSIRVQGYVADLAGAISECLMLVAPIVQGAGVKGKILESMACGTPVVGTAKAVEGLQVSDAAELLIADSPEQFSSRVLELASNRLLWSGLQSRGLRLIESGYSRAVLARELLALLDMIGRWRRQSE